MIREEELKSAIKDAEKLHGHLGPFLVIGVRIGNIAKTLLPSNNREKDTLQATAKIPLSTPFSCVLDGIQVTTKCTIGNQKLRIENSQREIAIYFELQNSDRTLRVSVNPRTVEELMNKISDGASIEELAWKIARAPEKQLFTIEKR